MKTRKKGQGCLLKLNGCRFWYAQWYRPDGKKMRVSTQTENDADAQAFLTKRMAESGSGLIQPDRKFTYADIRQGLLDSYTAAGNKSLLTTADGEETIPGLRQLDQFFGYPKTNGPAAIRITSDTAKEFVRERREAGVGNSIINRSLACLRRMLRLAKREHKIPDVPYIQFQKEPPPRKGFLPEADFNRLLKLLPSYLRPLVLLLYSTGVRIGEALQIEWTQVDLARGTIELEAEQAKTGEARHLPIHSELYALLDKAPKKVGRVFDGTNLRKQWVKACAAAGLGTLTPVEGKPYDPKYKGLTIHDLRRSAVRNLVNVGVPERTAMEISGHRTRAIFDRYHIVSVGDVVAAMRKLEANGLRVGRKKTLELRP